MPTTPSRPPVPASQALHLAGSTTMMQRMRHVAEAYMDERRDARIVIIDGGGTARGYKALLDRTVDIAMASGAVPAELAGALAASGRSLHSTVLSTEALVALVHMSNPVARLSMRQLANVFSGRIHNWKALGGPDAAIHVLVGLPGGGVSSSFRQLVLGDDATFTPSRVGLDTAHRLRQAAGDPLAITYAAMQSPDVRSLKMLMIDGLPPDVASPAYPLRVPLMLAIAGARSGATREFIGYAARQWHSAGSPESGHE